MSPPRHSLLLLLLLALTACSHLSPHRLVERVDTLAAQGELRGALSLLEEGASSGDAALQASLEERRAPLLEHAREREQALELDLAALVAELRWSEAAQRLEREAAQLPPSPALEHLVAAFEAQRAAAVREAVEHYQVLRGHHLLAEMTALRAALTPAHDDAALRHAWEERIPEAKQVGRALAQAGERHLAEGRATRALELLELASALSIDERIGAQARTLRQQQSEQFAQRRQAREAERRQRYGAVLEQARQARLVENFEAARSALREARSLYEDAHWQSENEALEAAIARRVRDDIEQGDRLYANGHVDQAMTRWQRAWALLPEPALAERIERARRFLQRYEELREGR